MNIRTLVAGGVIIAAIANPCLAFDTPTGSTFSAAQVSLSNVDGAVHANSLLQAVSCNVNDEDKQAYCMRACEEEYVDSSQQYNIKPEERMNTRKACESKCGC